LGNPHVSKTVPRHRCKAPCVGLLPGHAAELLNNSDENAGVAMGEPGVCEDAIHDVSPSLRWSHLLRTSSELRKTEGATRPYQCNSSAKSLRIIAKTTLHGSMPPITIHLSGAFRAEQHGKPLDALSRRAQGLLAYLVCQPGMRAERGVLADLLWSDRSEEQARASLRQELSVLRKLLAEALEADRRTVWLKPGAVHAEYGTGEFLQGFDLPSEGFEDWLRMQRAGQNETTAGVRPIPGTDRATLAVLPFEEIGVSDSDMFADGVAEEVTGALSRVRDFDVVARQSAYALLGQAISLPEAAKRLGADYLLQGSVRRAGERVRITVQLVRGLDGHLLWSERFDDRIDDLFDLQDRIAAQVAGQVSPSLRAAEIVRAGNKPPVDRTAYDLMLTAYPHFWSLRREDNARAAALLDRALERDLDYVPATALRAWVHAQQVTYMWTTDPIAERAQALALATRAAETVSDHVPSLVAIAGTVSQVGRDEALAKTFLDRALDIDPNNAWAWIRLGWLRQYTGNVDAALEAFDRAERLSPLDPFAHQITFGRAATHYRWSEDPTEGLAMIEEGLRRHPGVLWPWRMVAVANVRLGRLEAAQAAAARLLEGLPHLTIRYLRDCLPPAAVHFDDGYFEQLSIAGIPD
jgi:TolB-like protein